MVYLEYSLTLSNLEGRRRGNPFAMGEVIRFPQNGGQPALRRILDAEGKCLRLAPAGAELKPNEYREGVAGFVIQDGELLLERRSDRLDGGNLLDICSGHVEYPEEPVDAMRRELAEELGLEAQSLFLLGTSTMDFGEKLKSKDWFLYFFVVFVPRGQGLRIDEDEVSEILRIQPEEFTRLLSDELLKFPDNVPMRLIANALLKRCTAHRWTAY